MAHSLDDIPQLMRYHTEEARKKISARSRARTGDLFENETNILHLDADSNGLRIVVEEAIPKQRGVAMEIRIPKDALMEAMKSVELGDELLKLFKKSFNIP